MIYEYFPDSVVVGSCPTCKGPAQVIGNEERITEYRHVDLASAAQKQRDQLREALSDLLAAWDAGGQDGEDFERALQQARQALGDKLLEPGDPGPIETVDVGLFSRG